MAFILHIETSVALCSVCIAKDGDLLIELKGIETNDHAAQLTLLIQQALNLSDLTIGSVDAVAVSAGPGSYTGLRIGVSTAKGICQALDIPLIAVDTLQSMAWGAMKKYPAEALLFCPLIDARRMEVYTAIYNEENQAIFEKRALVIESNPFTEYLDKSKVVFFGSGLNKCLQLLEHDNALFPEAFEQSAQNLVFLALQSYREKRFADLPGFGPEYLKNFYSSGGIKQG